jgi:hypothetical protein
MEMVSAPFFKETGSGSLPCKAAHHATSTPASVGCTNANPWEFVVKALPLLFVVAALAACSDRAPAVDAPAPAEDHAATTPPASADATQAEASYLGGN